jgi:hypothetical protein
MRTTCFPLPLDTRDAENGTDAILLRGFQYHYGPIKIKVPAGFVTDYASIPWLLTPIFHPRGRYNRAAVVHDYLYKTGAVSRAVADAIFLEAMQILGVGFCRRYLMYWAVRRFGWIHYKKDT